MGRNLGFYLFPQQNPHLSFICTEIFWKFVKTVLRSWNNFSSKMCHYPTKKIKIIHIFAKLGKTAFLGGTLRWRIYKKKITLYLMRLFIWKENYQCFEFLILFDCVLLLRRLQTSRNVAKYQLINHKCFWTDNEINTFSEYTNIYTVTIKKKKMAKIATDRKANFFFPLCNSPFSFFSDFRLVPGMHKPIL